VSLDSDVSAGHESGEVVAALEEFFRLFSCQRKVADGAYQDILAVLSQELIASVRARDGSEPLRRKPSELADHLSQRYAYSDGNIGVSLNRIGAALTAFCGTRASPRPVPVPVRNRKYGVCVFGPKPKFRQDSDPTIWLEAVVEKLATPRADAQSTASDDMPGVIQFRRSQPPAPVGDFVGRVAEIAKAIAALRDGKIAVLFGVTGAGKTQLLLQIAKILARDPSHPWNDGQLFFECRETDLSRRSSDALLNKALKALGLTNVSDRGDYRDVYRAALGGQRLLIVADDVFDYEQAEALLPSRDASLIVACTARIAIPNAVLIEVAPLPPIDARNLLIAIAPSTSSLLPNDIEQILATRFAFKPVKTKSVPGLRPVFADALAFFSGYLPRGIRALGSRLVAERDLNPSDLTRQLLKHPLDFGSHGLTKSPTECLEAEYNALGEEGSRVFRSLVVFRYTFDARAVSEVCYDDTCSHLRELARRSLVDFDVGTRRYCMNELLWLFARSKVGDAEWQRLLENHAKYYASVAEAVMGSADDTGGAQYPHSSASNEGGNIELAFMWVSINIRRSTVAQDLASMLALHPEYKWPLWYNPRKSRELIEGAVESARRTRDAARLVQHLFNLAGHLYFEFSDADAAVDHYREAIELIAAGARLPGFGLGTAMIARAFHVAGRAEEFAAIEHRFDGVILPGPHMR
jgi:hypothetical protein